MNPVFQSTGFPDDGIEYGSVEIAAGETAGWQAETHDNCRHLLDMMTGLAETPCGAAIWFGHDIAALTQSEKLLVLQRILPMTPDGGLISNVNIAENVLLPYVHRNPQHGAQARERIASLLESPPWSAWFSVQRLNELPHQLNPLARALAAILRAWIAGPEAMIVCDMRHALEAKAAETVSRALVWLRAEMPDAAWLVVQTESSLPGNVAGNIMTLK